MKKNFVFMFLLAIVVVAAGVGIWQASKEKNETWGPVVVAPVPIAQATYVCQGDKTIEADFYQGEQKQVAPGEMPVPAGSVKIVLSDGRNFELAQTISADGGRYATEDEAFVFWSKGNGAIILENNTEKNYTGCITLAKDPGGLPQVYADRLGSFSIRYPADYGVDTAYKYQALGPGKEISGVKFIIPSSMATGTNLSSFDTGVSVETIPATEDCNAGLFLESKTNVQTVVENGSDYSFASTTDAAAGNRYEESVWALPGTNPCLAVRYFIHYGAIENYAPGLAQEFDRAALINQFEKMRRSLTAR
jgi:membrane-bound inhibitor of C-type lysozyme